MAVPKQKKSRSKSRMRRANHDKVDPMTMGWCRNCGSPKLPHRVCLSCGQYRGRVVLRVIE